VITILEFNASFVAQIMGAAQLVKNAISTTFCSYHMFKKPRSNAGKLFTVYKKCVRNLLFVSKAYSYQDLLALNMTSFGATHP